MADIEDIKVGDEIRYKDHARREIRTGIVRQILPNGTLLVREATFMARGRQPYLKDRAIRPHQLV